MDAEELKPKVERFMASIGWTKNTKTIDAAQDLYVTVDTMIDFIVEYCTKGPGPVPHAPPPPWPVEPRREDFVLKMTGVLLNYANRRSP